VALALRKTGMSLETIARHAGYSNRSSVHRALDRAMREIIRVPAEQLIVLELERMDAAVAGLWPKIEEGDPEAIRAMVVVMRRRASMLGLDAPPQKPDAAQAVAVAQAAATVVVNLPPDWQPAPGVVLLPEVVEDE
jgi:lambda repressor-like predicted transcriptional regulator